ncbi:kinase-like protein [Athelia psychrophila]|uniref:Kinase-like protein n=1 Tax=Athelia psychrophila TaxID=1759441 RepID=A0A166LJY1_9AGAM|nr:kinase-like protein [Fibularhizoctonia sp. CBS 109695]
MSLNLSASQANAPITQWVRGEVIANTTYARIYLALDETNGAMIVAKQVEIPRTAPDKADARKAAFLAAQKSEIEILHDLGEHPNIVRYLGFAETPDLLTMFLDYVPGGSVHSCLTTHGRFEESVTKSFAAQILAGLEYLHSRKIIHNDLKGENILVGTSGICMIADFSIATRAGALDASTTTSQMTGTVCWMAPEVIAQKGYDSKIDIWSFGCVVLEMWSGKQPWSGEEAGKVILELHKHKCPPPIPHDVVLPPLALEFRNLCFAADPKNRPTAAELRRHAYLELSAGWAFTGFAGSDRSGPIDSLLT